MNDLLKHLALMALIACLPGCASQGDVAVKDLLPAMTASTSASVSPAPFPMRLAPARITDAAQARAMLTSITTLEPGIQLNISYARSDNFLGRPFYPLPRAYLQRHAAEGVARAHRALAAQGYGLMVYDAYRPWSVSMRFWNAVTQDQRDRGFVADPAKGSRHNRACAVDVTLFDLKTGAEVRMPSTVDEMSDAAAADYPGGTSEQRAARDVLRKAMEAQGFTVLAHEWWHYDCAGWRDFPLMDVDFQALETASS